MPDSHVTWPQGVGNALNIVIVDDQTSARTMLRHVIEDIASELAVHDFGDPLAALEWCEKNRTDLLLLDYRMPEMDGLTALSMLMTERPTAVIMVSSLTEKGAMTTLEALALGAVDALALAPPVVATARGPAAVGRAGGRGTQRRGHGP